MRILYYCWNENSAADIEQVFNSLGFFYIKITYPLSNYDFDGNFESQVIKLLQQQQLDCIYTFNYFPILSNIAEKCQIPYISWIYDCPHLTLYSRTITNSCNHIFLFDRNMLSTVISLGAVHTCHLPLAVNTHRLNTQLHLPERINSDSFTSDVSFVGSLYENNMYSQVRQLPEYIRGYYDAVMNSQQEIWGCNFVEELLDKDIIEETLRYIGLENNPNYMFEPRNILANMLNQRITSDERIRLLNKVSNNFSMNLYTGSDKNLIKNCNTHGFISYTDTMPSVFCSSRININISLRSITSGIPLRCLDIMGAGGFLLSNYQPELAEYFIPNEEFVYFESETDLLEKVQYYLIHEDERRQIAYNGWKKIQEQFSYETQFTKICTEI